MQLTAKPSHAIKFDGQTNVIYCFTFFIEAIFNKGGPASTAVHLAPSHNIVHKIDKTLAEKVLLTNNLLKTTNLKIV